MAPCLTFPQATRVIVLRPGWALEITWRPVHTGSCRIPQGRPSRWTDSHRPDVESETRRERGEDEYPTRSGRNANASTERAVVDWGYTRPARTRS